MKNKESKKLFFFFCPYKYCQVSQHILILLIHDLLVLSFPGLGFYGGAEAQVSSSGDALSLTSEDRAVPSTEPQTTPGSEDLTTGPKIAAGPPPPEYETLDHVSGEFSNFTRSYSQAYHSKGKHERK